MGDQQSRIDLVFLAFGFFEYPLGPLAIGDVIDRKENRLESAFGGKAASVEEHRLRTDIGEIVFHLEIVERTVQRQYFLEQRS